MSSARLHRSEVLDALEAELDKAGFMYREKCGRKHGRLLVDVNGREETIIVSGSPSDHRASKNAVAFIRRKIKSWKAEMEPQQMEPTRAVETQLDYSLIAPRDAEIGGAPVQVVDARDLHAFLRVGKVFGAWISERIEQYGFIENVDYEVFSEIGKNPRGGRPTKEYAITIDMAKELSMVERNEMGRAARLYFIECERRLRAGAASPMVVRNDEAILDLIVAGNQDMLAAQSRSAHELIEHVEGGKAAVLRYLKMYVREPLDGIVRYQADFRQATQKRDRAVFDRITELERAVATLLKKAEQPLMSRPFVFSEWYDHARIYETFAPNQHIPNRAFLSRAISKSLDAYCKRRQRGHDMQSRYLGGRHVSFWHRDSVIPWADITGRDMIQKHIIKFRRGADVLAFRRGK